MSTNHFHARRPYLATAVLAALLPAAAAAQERVRIAPKAVPLQSAPPITARQQPAPVRVDAIQRTAVAADEPDFIRREDVRDESGAVVGTRPVGNPYTLAFRGGDFVPEPGIDPRMLARMRRDPGGHTYGFVMLKGRMAAAKLDALRGLGLELYGVHTYQSVKAKIPLRALPQLGALEFVHWVGYPRPAQKLDPALAGALTAAGPAGEVEVYVTSFAPLEVAAPVAPAPAEPNGRLVQAPIAKVEARGPVRDALAATGFRPKRYLRHALALRGVATAAQVRALQELDAVLYIEPHRRDEAFHDQTMAMISQDRVRLMFPGTRVPVGIIDSGIDMSPGHNDFAGKSFVGWDTTGQGVFADANGHGTHVAGTLFGRGLVDARYRGAAPAVGLGGGVDRIFIGRYLKNDGFSQGDVEDLFDAFSENFSSGGLTSPKPRVINNSWGKAEKDGFHGTEARAREVDGWVFQTDQCYVIAAGNKDKVDNLWCASPGSAKNALTVGAVVDMRAGGQQPGDKASFSRYGVRDGRIKPDIMAPGDTVTSTDIDTATGYRGDAGTSMATPHVTGMLASLIDRSSQFDLNVPALKAAAMAVAEVRGEPRRLWTHGFGTVNAFKLNFAGRTSYEVASGRLFRTGDLQLFDTRIPSDAQALKIVMNYIESAASGGASQARINDVWCVVDVEPFSSSPTGGEAILASGSDNVLWRLSESGTTSGALVDLARGKRVRFKLFARSIPFAGWAGAKWGLAVQTYHKQPKTDAGLLLSTNVPAVRPNGAIDLEAKWFILTGGSHDEFESAWLGVEPGSPFLVTGMRRRGADNVLQVYGASGFPSFPFPSLTTGMVVGQGQDRRVTFNLRAPWTSGLQSVYVLGRHPEIRSDVRVRRRICVDGQAPDQLTGLRSTSHVVGGWSNNPNITLAWTRPADNGCAGLDGYRYDLQVGAPDPLPNRVLGNVTAATFFSGHAPAGQYISLTSVDRAGNRAPGIASIGPFLIDRVAPVVNSLTLANGSSTTSNRFVFYSYNATEADSGISKIRLSLNNRTWSSWMTPPMLRLVDVTSATLGGNGLPGYKWVYLQAMDRAGNVSNVASRWIYYLGL